MIQGPPPEVVRRFYPLLAAKVPAFAILERRFPGARATSWYRTPVRNRQVGGHPRSQHLLALGVDWSVPSDQRAGFVRTATSLGLHGVVESDHIHVQAYAAGRLPVAFFGE